MTSFNEMCYIIAKKVIICCYIIGLDLSSLHGTEFKGASGGVITITSLKERMTVKKVSRRKIML